MLLHEKTCVIPIITHCRPTYGTMKKSYSTLTVTRHQEDNLGKTTSSLLPHQDDCNARKDNKYCITLRTPHKQWEQHFHQCNEFWQGSMMNLYCCMFGMSQHKTNGCCCCILLLYLSIALKLILPSWPWYII